jgi:hypothetical protein
MKGITAQGEVLKIINEEGLDSKSRKRSRVYRRQYLMWFLRNKTNMSLEEIGDMFKRDHATTIHAVKAVSHMLDTKDQYFVDYIADISNKLDEFNFSKPRFKTDTKRVISVYVSSDEYNEILNAADRQGTTMYQFVLDCIRGERSIID